MGDKKYKQKHKELGLCSNCSNPVYADYSKCLKHIISGNKNSKKYRNKNLNICNERVREIKAKYTKKNRCYRCSAPLDPDADAGFVNCINCRESTHTERVIHGTPIV